MALEYLSNSLKLDHLCFWKITPIILICEEWNPSIEKLGLQMRKLNSRNILWSNQEWHDCWIYLEKQNCGKLLSQVYREINTISRNEFQKVCSKKIKPKIIGQFRNRLQLRMDWGISYVHKCTVKLPWSALNTQEQGL